MIILIYGEDTYRSGERIKDLMSEYKKKYSNAFGLRYLDSKTTTLDDLKNEMFEISMFQQKKLIIFESAFGNLKFKEAFLKNNERFFDNDNVLIFYERSTIPAKDKMFDYLKKKDVKIESFENLKGVKLKAYLLKKIKEEEVDIQNNALDKVIDYIGGDLWRLSNEIKKLINYISADKRKEVTEKDVEKIIVPDLDLNIFNTIDAIAVKDKKKAINLFKEHLRGGAEVPYLFSMIAWQIKNIIIAKSGAKDTGISPFVLRKASYQAKNFSFEDLKRIYAKLTDLDASLKVGKILPEAALDLLVLEI
ncbi:MAG: DNA polymerase III subunit delta [Candidatus Paceibacterota bacterium]|jgi:DNA polymerase-3 subunit delta